MTLNDVLKQDSVVGLSDQGVLDYLSQNVQQSSNQLWSYDKVVKDQRFGLAIATGLYNAMVGAGLTPAAMLYVTAGIDLSLPDTQSGLDSIAAAVPQLSLACNTLKSLGVWSVTRWSYLGLSALPLLSNIVSERVNISNQAKITLFCNNSLNSLIGSGTATPEQIKALVASWNP